MKKNSRYNKKGFGYYFFKRFRILILFALILHCFMVIVVVRSKQGSFISNNCDDIDGLVGALLEIPFREDSINEVFSESYPNMWDYNKKGLEKAAIVISEKDREIIAANDFTLPENELLIKLKKDKEYIPPKLKLDSRFNLLYLERDATMKMCIDGHPVILITAMRVNYYTYFLKYFLTADIILLMSALIISLYGAGKENIQKIKDEYRRSIINSLSHDLKTPLTAIIG